MRKVFDVRAFQAGYFLLAALSFNSLTAGRRFMSLLTALVLLWGAALLLLRFREQKLRMFRTGPCMAGISLFLVSYAVSSLWNLSYGIAGNLKAMAWMTLEFFLLYAGPEPQDRTEHRKRDQREDPARGLVQVVILYTAVQAVISLGMLCAGYQGVSVERGMYIGLQEGRLWGAYSDPNYGAVLAASALALSLGAAIRASGKKVRLLLIGNAVLQYFYLVFSYSRTGWIGFAASMILLYLHVLRSRRPRAVVRFGGAILLAVLLLGGAPIREAYNAWQQRVTVYAASMDEKQADADIFEFKGTRMELPAEAEPEESQKAPLHREDELEDDISNGRFSVWKDGIELWETSPVVGISYRNISAYAQKNLPDCYILNKEVALNTFHNLFVDVLVSQGLAGILILLGVLVAILRSSIRGCRRLKAGKLQTRDQAALLGAALLPIIIGALFLSDILYMNSPSSVLFWILLGSWCRMMREPEGENKYE